MILAVGFDKVQKMSTHTVTFACLCAALIYILASRLTGIDIMPYAEVLALIGGLLSLKQIPNVGVHSATAKGLMVSIQQQAVGMGLWLILKFGSLKSIFGDKINVQYRTLGNIHYAEVYIYDGSRQSKIYVPLIRGRYRVRITGAPKFSDPAIEVPYTTFYSNGYTWSIPVRPERLGYNNLEVELSDSDNPNRCFKVQGSELADLETLIQQYQIETSKTTSALAEAYD